jgi:hypothetical protein
MTHGVVMAPQTPLVPRFALGCARICFAFALVGCRGGSAGEDDDETGTGSADDGGSGEDAGDDDGGDDDGGEGGATTSSSTRRLSVAELRNSYRDVLGVVPVALDDIPPDSLGLTFDRVVNAQTVSAAHLDGFAAAAREAVSTTIAQKSLDERVPECADEILPPLSPSVVAEVPGTALSAGPEWAIQPTDVPDAIFIQYATEVTLSYSHLFPAAGEYVVALDFDVVDGTGTEILVSFDGELVATFDAFGGPPYEVTVEATAEGTGVLDWAINGEGNFTLLVRGLEVEGPADPGAQYTAERAACVEAFVDRLAPLAFRRPLDAARREQILGLVELADGDWGEALKMVAEAIFANPSFLYLVEIGTEVEDEPGAFALDAWERAARIGYALCESPPDAELRAAAADGELSTPEQVESHVRRLLDSPCGEATVQRFVSQLLWLYKITDLDRDAALFPVFSPEVAAGMLAETERFVRELVWVEDASLVALLSADYSWPDPRSATLYGLPTPAEQMRTQLPEERAGILTQPSVLAVTSTFDTTSPVRRGVFVLEHVLCEELPPPPEGLMITPPPPDPDATTRERWEQHSSDPTCSGCHQLIDPIGFALEEFDAIGQHRTQENGLPVDPTGGVPAIGAPDGSIVGGAALARAVAESPQAVSCFAKQWLRFTLGRLETETDDESLAIVEAALADGSLHDALVSITATSVFTHRYQEVQ